MVPSGLDAPSILNATWIGIGTVSSVGCGAVGWLFKRFVRRYDNLEAKVNWHETRISQLENAVGQSHYLRDIPFTDGD